LVRRTTVSSDDIAQNKRAIYKFNQARNDALITPHLLQGVQRPAPQPCPGGQAGQSQGLNIVAPDKCKAMGKRCTVANVTQTQTQYTFWMKTAVIPQVRVEPELRAELQAVLKRGETLTEFVEATVRHAIAFRRMQTEFHARAQAASEAYHRTGASRPVDAVLDKLQAKLDTKRQKLSQ
jgi:hypothetical protein